MVFHDTYLRRTPFELAFPDGMRLEGWRAAVEEEAEQLGVDLWNRGAFMLLGSVGSLLRDLRPPEVGAEAFHDYGALVFQSFHFHRTGRMTLLVTTALARQLAEEGGRDATAPLEAPAPAGYAQLPRHLFWVRTASDVPPEPVDGVFWALAGGEALHLLLTLGIREGRPGMGVVPVPEAPWADAPRWLDAPMRDAGRDFATTLPGGELDGLHSVETAGEALKLVARLFRHVQEVPASLTMREPTAEGQDQIAPSALPYRRVDVDA